MTTKAVGVALVALVAVMLAPAGARAHDRRDPCPGATVEGLSDSLAAAQQAICWYERDRDAQSDCVARAGESGRCIENAAGWCEIADLRVDRQVANTCFMARIRAGDLTGARATIPVLTEMWPDAVPCRAALTVPLRVRVTSEPVGAELSVSGRAAGRAPRTLELPQPFEQQRIRARVRRDGATSELQRGPQDLLEAFDPRTCRMGTLTFAADVEAGRQHDVLSPPAARGDGATADTASSGSVFSRWWFWAIAGAVVVGTAVTVAVVAASGSETQPSIPGDDGVIVMTLRAP